MRYIFSILLCGAGIFAQAQTKKIAFKSHSGKMEHFQLAVETGFGDTDNSNFGAAPDPVVKTAQLDSVILLCDTAAIMITSEYCSNRWDNNKTQTKWRAGKDTVYRHPLFNNHLPLDSIRKILSTQYHFRNPAEKVVFIGFEEPITKNNRRNGNGIAFTGYINNDHDPFDSQFAIITRLIFGLSLLGAGIAWKLHSSRVYKFTSSRVNPIVGK